MSPLAEEVEQLGLAASCTDRELLLVRVPTRLDPHLAAAVALTVASLTVRGTHSGT